VLLPPGAFSADFERRAAERAADELEETLPVSKTASFGNDADRFVSADKKCLCLFQTAVEDVTPRRYSDLLIEKPGEF
jgi:hypothetical protein